MPRTSPEIIEKIGHLGDRGLTSGQIAQRLGINGSTAYYHMIKLGVARLRKINKRTQPYARNGRTVRPFTHDEDQKILAMKGDGFGWKKIAEAIGRARSNSVAERYYILLARQNAEAEA